MPTILVIDDSQSNAQLIKIALETSGYQVACAYTGQDGLAVLEEIRPDLLVLDLRLPGSTFDGWTIIRMLRDDPNYRNMPILVTSVEVTPDDRTRAFDAGCNEYFSKPFSIGDLRQQISRYVGPP
ncbi:MAG: response regulator [Anaerolineae bacterium]